MFRTAKEKTTARLRWVEGQSIREIARSTGESKNTVERRLKILAACLFQLGVNVANPEKVREFIGEVLRRAA